MIGWQIREKPGFSAETGKTLSAKAAGKTVCSLILCPKKPGLWENLPKPLQTLSLLLNLCYNTTV